MKRSSTSVNISTSTNRPPRDVDTHLLTPQQGVKRQRNSHLFEREEHDHYVEPHWLSQRLFEVEDLDRSKPMLDPCTGWGRIADAAKAAGYRVATADIVDRGYAGCVVGDFLQRRSLPPAAASSAIHRSSWSKSLSSTPSSSAPARWPWSIQSRGSMPHGIGYTVYPCNGCG